MNIIAVSGHYNIMMKQLVNEIYHVMNISSCLIKCYTCMCMLELACSYSSVVPKESQYALSVILNSCRIRLAGGVRLSYLTLLKHFTRRRLTAGPSKVYSCSYLWLSITTYIILYIGSDSNRINNQILL